MRASSLGASIFSPCPMRNFHVGEGQRPVLRRNEILAVHAQQQVEHALVQHLPRADLLLDHVEAGAFDVRLRGS